MISLDKKQTVINQYARFKGDVGSSEVQVAILTARIEEVSNHLKVAKKDNMARRGLLQMVGKRRRLLDYLAKHKPETYLDLIKKLKLRK